MRRRTPAGQEVGIDLLLAASDAFGYLADELATDYARRHGVGDQSEILEWAKRMAEFAGWWCGRLEAEADHLAGFGSDADSGLNGSPTISADLWSGISPDRDIGACRRGRWRPRS